MSIPAVNVFGPPIGIEPSGSKSNTKTRGSLLADFPLPAHCRLWRVLGFDRGKAAFDHRNLKRLEPGQGSPRYRGLSQMQSNSRRPQGVCDVARDPPSARRPASKAAGTRLEIVIDGISYRGPTVELFTSVAA
jgi:hypothetical protein